MNFEPGKCYSIESYSWVLYPDQRTAQIIRDVNPNKYVNDKIGHYRKEFNSGILLKNSNFMVLELIDKVFVHVIASNGIGWLYVDQNKIDQFSKEDRFYVSDCFRRIK